MPSRQLDTSWSPSRYSTRWEQRTITWSSLSKMLIARPVGPLATCNKASAPMWVPARLKLTEPIGGKLYGRRQKVNVAHVSSLVLDYDELDFLKMRKVWGYWSQWRAVAHTTGSATIENPKLRIIVYLDQDISADLWTHFIKVATSHCQKETGIQADPKCTDSSRPFYLPHTASPDSFWWSERAKEGAPPFACTPVLATAAQWIVAERAEEKRKREAALRESRLRYAGMPKLPIETSYKHLLDNDPVIRKEVLSNYKVNEDIARHMPCPGCSKNTVWAPTHAGLARCNHVLSCGWVGPLDQLDIPEISQWRHAQ